MSSTTQTILMTASTGRQSSAAIRSLLALPHPPKIHATTRDPTSASAEALASLSPQIQLFKANNDDSASLISAAQGCQTAFINVIPSFTDPGAEVHHAQNILSALKQVPTMHRIVYSSVLGCVDPDKPNAFSAQTPPLDRKAWMYNYYKSKSSIEALVQSTAEATGWQWTILQPGTFLTNHIAPFTDFIYPQLKTERKLVTALPATCRLGYLDPTTDIGGFLARMLSDPDDVFERTWMTKKVPLAVHHLTLAEVAESMNESLGLTKDEEKVKVQQLSEEEIEQRVKAGDVLTMSVVHQGRNPHRADVDEVRSYGIDLGTMEGFWKREDANLRKAVGL